MPKSSVPKSKPRKSVREPSSPLPKEGNVLGLDLSTTGTGISVYSMEGKFLHGETVSTGKEMGVHRMQLIRDRVIAVAKEYNPIDTIAEYFGVAKGSGSLAVVWLHGLVIVALAENGYPPPMYMAPSSLKKLSTNDGHAEKKDMKDALMRISGVYYDNDNTVDAALLAYWLTRWYSWRSSNNGFSEYEDMTFSKMKRSIGAV